MMINKLLTSAAVAVILAVSPSLAQETGGQPIEEPVVQDPATAEPSQGTAVESSANFVAEQKEGHWLTTNLIGQEVKNPAGETIGEVAGLEINPENKIVAVVIDTGGFLGLGSKRVAVPFESVQHTYSPEEQSLVISSSAEAIDAAPQYLTLLQVQRAKEAEQARMEAEQNQPVVAPEPATTE